MNTIDKIIIFVQWALVFICTIFFVVAYYGDEIKLMIFYGFFALFNLASLIHGKAGSR